MLRVNTKKVAAWVLSFLLALAFLLAGIPKLLAIAGWTKRFANWGYPRWFLLLIGLLEVIGAILLLVPRFAIYGVGILIAVMLGAGYTHLANGEGLQIVRPLIFLSVLLAVGWLRRFRTSGDD